MLACCSSILAQPMGSENTRPHSRPARRCRHAFRILPDPDYRFTLAYGLRWEAPQETAYPSTFVFDRNGVVTFAHTSRSHGDRVTAASVLKVLSEGSR